MKLLKWFLLLLALAIIIFIGLLSLKSDKFIVKARYMMESCEKCNHMLVDAAGDKRYAGKIIIPESTAVDIEKLVDDISLSRKSVCFVGRAYLYNFNALGIKPDGIRFKVEGVVPEQECLGLVR